MEHKINISYVIIANDIQFFRYVNNCLCLHTLNESFTVFFLKIFLPNLFYYKNVMPLSLT